MDGYYSITITDHGLIRLIGFVSQISTHLLKNFINKFYLILLNGKIIFYVTVVGVLGVPTAGWRNAPAYSQ